MMVGPGVGVPRSPSVISSGGVPTGFVLTDVASGRVFQRTAGQTTGPVSIAGTYSGGDPSSVQAQCLKVSDNSVVVDWTGLTSASIGAGAWSGSLAGVPQGGGYYIKARPANATGLAATGSNSFFVGMWLIMYGQSNMLNMSSTSTSPPAANTGTGYYDNTGFRSPPAADGVRYLLNNLNTATGIPCAALNGAVSGVPISWLSKGDPSGDYTALAAQITAAGGDFEWIVWHQGEGDSANATTEGAYQAALDQLHADLCTDFGRTKATAKLVVAGLAVVTGGASGFGNDASWDQMERTLLDVPTNLANAYYSHSNRDANIINANVHWDGTSYGHAGQRYARTISTLLGSTTGTPPWAIASSAVVNGTTTTVVLTPGLGTDFTPTSGITGFDISGDNGGTWSACTGVRTNATTITLTHASVATNSNRKLRYQYGIDPDVSGCVLDNSSLASPLSNSAGTLSPTPLAVLPVPTYSASSGTASASTATQQLVNASIGAAATQRMIIIGSTHSNGQTPISSITVAPNVGTTVTATIDKDYHAGAFAPSAIIAHAVLLSDADTATTATITINFSANPFATSRIGVWYLPSGNLSSVVPVDAEGSSANGTSVSSMSLNLATSSGGFAIAIAANEATSADAGTITSPNETWAQRAASVLSAGVVHIAADASGLTTQAADAITAAWTTGHDSALIAVSWR